MKRERLAALSLVWLLASACGSDSDENGRGAGSGVDWSQIDPPDNIDITSCAGIVDSGGASLDQCGSCCFSAGFNTATFINDDHCTCASDRDDGRDTVCAAEASAETVGPCQACCNAAGFSGYGWVGGGGPSSQCTCSSKGDEELCREALENAEPIEACSYCCLENGFAISRYSNFEGEECRCVDI